MLGVDVYAGGSSSLRMSLTEAWSPGPSEFRELARLPGSERLEVDAPVAFLAISPTDALGASEGTSACEANGSSMLRGERLDVETPVGIGVTVGVRNGLWEDIIIGACGSS